MRHRHATVRDPLLNALDLAGLSVLAYWLDFPAWPTVALVLVLLCLVVVVPIYTKWRCRRRRQVLTALRAAVAARRRAEQACRACEAQLARERGLRRRTELHLTPRESEILDLLLAGRSNPEIADELTIEPKTVGTHVHNLGIKLGLTGRITRAAIKAAAREQGVVLLSSPPAQVDDSPAQPKKNSTLS